mgnify:CR=1 FL=1
MNLRTPSNGHAREAIGFDGSALADALRSERRHAAVSWLATGMALGIAFSLAIDMAIASAARM